MPHSIQQQVRLLKVHFEGIFTHLAFEKYIRRYESNACRIQLGIHFFLIYSHFCFMLTNYTSEHTWVFYYSSRNFSFLYFWELTHHSCQNRWVLLVVDWSIPNKWCRKHKKGGGGGGGDWLGWACRKSAGGVDVLLWWVNRSFFQ